MLVSFPCVFVSCLQPRGTHRLMWRSRKRKLCSTKDKRKVRHFFVLVPLFSLLRLSFHWPLCVGAKACPSGCPPALLSVSFGCVLSGTNSVVRDALDSSGRWGKANHWEEKGLGVRHGAPKQNVNAKTLKSFDIREGRWTWGGCEKWNSAAWLMQ